MFNLIKIENARMNVPEPQFYAAAANEDISTGEALVLSDGALTKCGATVAPQFISIGCVSATDTNRKLAVCRVESNQLYEVPVVASPTDLQVGDKVTLHTDGLQVTATTEDGVVTIVSLNGASAQGDRVIVRI